LDLLPAAVLISLVGFVESVSVAQTLAAKRRQRIVANQELIGLGTANLASAISGGYPVTGGFARSVVNFDAGAATPLAGAATALGILGATLFLTPLFRYLPQAVLAATIIVAVLSLVDLAAIRRTFVYSKADFAAMAATILTGWSGSWDCRGSRAIFTAVSMAHQHAARRDRGPGAWHRTFPQYPAASGAHLTGVIINSCR
jgi:SulP family sulfate permease